MSPYALKAMFIRIRKAVSVVILIAFTSTSVKLPAYAQDFRLPAPGGMVHLSPALNPPILKGIKVHPENPFKFEFILDKGDSQLSNDQLKDESSRLIKYFLASLTIPEKDLWVNLSPYEKDRIIPNSFGLTEMGRDLMAEDYMLKQITASLIYPEGETGKRFWKRVYEEAAKRYGTTNVPVNTFNKVWVVPEKAVVYENVKAGTAYVMESRLKVMLEQDYLSLQKHEGIQSNHVQAKSANQLGSQIVREIILPQLSKEVNENNNFARLRQVYNSLILATWYKKKIKDSILSEVYADKNKVAGVKVSDPQEKQKIYQRYLRAFKKGVFNLIQEENDPITQEAISRKYFSGGFSLALTSFRIRYLEKIDPKRIISGTLVIMALLSPIGFLGNFSAYAKQKEHKSIVEQQIPFNASTLLDEYPLASNDRKADILGQIGNRIAQGDDRVFDQVMERLRAWGELSLNSRQLLAYIIDPEKVKIKDVTSISILTRLADNNRSDAIPRILELVNKGNINAIKYYLTYLARDFNTPEVQSSIQILLRASIPQYDEYFIEQVIEQFHFGIVPALIVELAKRLVISGHLEAMQTITSHDMMSFDDMINFEESLHLSPEAHVRLLYFMDINAGKRTSAEENTFNNLVGKYLHSEHSSPSIVKESDHNYIDWLALNSLDLDLNHWLPMRIMEIEGRVWYLQYRILHSRDVEHSFNTILAIAAKPGAESAQAQQAIDDLLQEAFEGQLSLNKKAEPIRTYFLDKFDVLFHQLNTKELIRTLIGLPYRSYAKNDATSFGIYYDSFVLFGKLYKLAQTNNDALHVVTLLYYGIENIPGNRNLEYYPGFDWKELLKGRTLDAHVFHSDYVYSEYVEEGLLMAYLEAGYDVKAVFRAFIANRGSFSDGVGAILDAAGKYPDLRAHLWLLNDPSFIQGQKLDPHIYAKLLVDMMVTTKDDFSNQMREAALADSSGQFVQSLIATCWKIKSLEGDADTKVDFNWNIDGIEAAKQQIQSFLSNVDLSHARNVASLPFEPSELEYLVELGNVSALAIMINNPEYHGNLNTFMTYHQENNIPFPPAIDKKFRNLKSSDFKNSIEMQKLLSKLGDSSANLIIANRSYFSELMTGGLTSLDAEAFKELKFKADTFIGYWREHKDEFLGKLLAPDKEQVEQFLTDVYFAIMIQAESQTEAQGRGHLFSVNSFNEIIKLFKAHVKLTNENNAYSSGELGFPHLIGEFNKDGVDGVLKTLAHETGHNWLEIEIGYNLVDKKSPFSSFNREEKLSIHEFVADLFGIWYMKQLSDSKHAWSLFDHYYKKVYPQGIPATDSEPHTRARYAIDSIEKTIEADEGLENASNFLAELVKHVQAVLAEDPGIGFQPFVLHLLYAALNGNGQMSDPRKSRIEDVIRRSRTTPDDTRDIKPLLIEVLRDPAMRGELKGGIDLSLANNVLQTQNAGQSIKFQIDAAQLTQLQNAPGFVPVIINIQPMRDLRNFLGLEK